MTGIGIVEKDNSTLSPDGVNNPMPAFIDCVSTDNQSFQEGNYCLKSQNINWKQCYSRASTYNHITAKETISNKWILTDSVFITKQHGNTTMNYTLFIFYKISDQ